MIKSYWLCFIVIITWFRPAIAQSKLDGVYQGMEEIAWTDSQGIRHNAILSQDSSKWYHENILIIRADSIFLDQCPIHFKNGKKWYSASSGGFYSYAGIIIKGDSSLIAKLNLLSCDYCPEDAVMVDESTGVGTNMIDEAKKVVHIYIITKTKKGLILNDINYQRLSSRRIKKSRFL